MKRFEGKVALVTGAAGGLGGATAKRLAEEGARVFMADLADGSELASEIGGTLLTLDVSDEAAWQSVVLQVLDAAGRIDVLVNAAGIEGDLAHGKLQTTYEDFRRVCSVNLDGTFLGCMAVMPHMMERGNGAIVNIASIITSMGTPSALGYGVSKAGVEQLSRSLALVGAEDGKRVRVNSVHPGVIETRMTDDIIKTFSRGANVSFEEAEAVVNSAVAFKERGQPEDVAAMIAYLASDEAGYVTGSAFKVDGGWSVINAG